MCYRHSIPDTEMYVFQFDNTAITIDKFLIVPLQIKSDGAFRYSPKARLKRLNRLKSSRIIKQHREMC